MQIKTIEKTIQNKMEDWLSSIKDENLRNDIRKNLLVSGGSITSMLLGEPVNDYDVYLMDINVVKSLAQYYCANDSDITIMDGREKDTLESEGPRIFHDEDDFLQNSWSISLRNLKSDQIKLYFKGAQGAKKITYEEEPDKYSPIFYSPNAISLTDQIQIVLRFWGTAEQIHKTFDFIHATNYFTFKDGLVRNLPAIESILTKQLRYQGSFYPVTSIIRSKKFIKRGWNINAGEYLKIMFQISELDLSNPDVLEEQLIGVDVAYFGAIIEALRNKYESDNDFRLSSEYLNLLIDRIFNEGNENE